MKLKVKTKINNYNIIIGKNLCLKINKIILNERNYGKGYSIKTKRVRLTKWGSNGELGYELYDHKNDKNELINLANNQDYSEIMDSLKLVIEKRIADASIKPKGLGRQFENAKPMYKAKNITFGDIHDTAGEITYFKK